MADTTSDRLVRIEQKLERMETVLIAIARFEEKMDAYNEYRERSWERMNKFSEKLDNIEKKVNENAHTVGIINKVVYAAVVAAVGTYVAHMWM
jgi:hypothetical protein|tara:strand:- start:3977 stop:4255 length:279 start_codon:yes stop_codon:yes gene_type:complete